MTVIRVGTHEVEIAEDGLAAYDVAEVFPGIEPTLLVTLLGGPAQP